MSWNLAATLTREQIENGELDGVDASPLPEADSAAEKQVRAAKAAAEEIVASGVVGNDSVVVNIHGHSTEDNEPADGQHPVISIALSGKKADPEPVEPAEPGSVDSDNAQVAQANAAEAAE